MRGLSIAALTVAATLGFSGSAPAAPVPYDVWSCRLPEGTPAPVDGWAGKLAYGAEVWMRESCSAGRGPADRALSAVFGAPVSSPNETRWTFSAPADTTVSDVTLWRAARSSTYYAAGYWSFDTDVERRLGKPALATCMDYQNGCAAVGSMEDPDAASNRADFVGLAARELYSSLVCTGLVSTQPCQHPAGAEFRLFRARIGLLDQTVPELAEAMTGTLATATPIEGSAWLTFSATDRGGGISSVGLLLDGRVVLERPPDPSDARCVKPYVVRVPCPLATAVTLTYDTGALPNGTHVTQAFATDVSGNRATSPPFPVTTRNGSEPNGLGATRAARLTASLTDGTGRQIRGAIGLGRGSLLRGALTTLAGTPIAGASLDVLVRVSRPGSVPHLRKVTTDSTGRYVYRLPGGASRQFDVAYRAYGLDEAYSALASAALKVRASIKLSVSSGFLHNGQQVTFRGRLVGGPRRQDASMILYALGDRRIPVTSLKADSRGRFSYTYRFRTVGHRSTFRFQVRTESRPGYPYAAGASKLVRVVVRP